MNNNTYAKMKCIPILAVILSFFCFISCSKSEEIIMEKKSLSFQVTNFKQYSFDEISRADVSILDRLAFCVYDAETSEIVVPEVLQSKGEDNYGQFSVSLYPGTYRVVFLGYNGSRTCDLSNLEAISFSDSYVPQTFLYSAEITVDDKTPEQTQIELHRVVAAIKVTLEDAIPEGVVMFRFTSTGGGTSLNAKTEFSPVSAGRTWGISVPEDRIGKQGVKLTGYLFLTSQTEQMDFTLEALNQNGEIICSKSFQNVPMGINTISCYKGKFFDKSVSANFHLSVDDQWAETREFTY